MNIRVLVLLLLPCVQASAAVDRAEPTTAFNAIGYIQSFTLDSPGDPLSSARMTVNGLNITLPANLKIVMPGSYLTANDIFRGPNGTKSAPVLAKSCMALDDRVDAQCATQPEFPYTAEIVGNIVEGQYIAGLVTIGQIPLQTASGFIKSIDYQKGELTVGPSASSSTVAARVRLNDPAARHSGAGGRFGKAISPDWRFKADQDNPTVHAATGYPVCIPRVDPAAANDTDCPRNNRPCENPANGQEAACPASFLPSASSRHRTRFTVGALPARTAAGAVSDAPVCAACNPAKMVPLAVGDYVVYAGTLQKEGGQVYISASSLEADLGIFTSPGANPAYVFIEEAILGTGGTAFPGIDQETGPGKVIPGQNIVTRFRIIGFTTDPSRNVDVFALDVTDAASADKRPRLLTSVPPEAVAPIGRFRVTVDQQVFMPPPREVRAQIQRTVDAAGNRSPERAANGLEWGQYTAPVGEYIFPEGRVFGGKRPEPGLIPANFEDLCFLSVGFGPLDTLDRDPENDAGLPTVGPLAPWPASEREPRQAPASAHQPPGRFCR